MSTALTDLNVDPHQQFGRVCFLAVTNRAGETIDLSQLRIKFAVKHSDTATPNTADIRVYNLEAETAILIRKEFTKVVLQAGYVNNYGIIFKGNIKQVIIGRESGTDTFIDILSGDGDNAYNFAIVNTTLAKNSSLTDHVDTAVQAMTAKGVTAGNLNTASMPTTKLPRGKVMYGNARKFLRQVAETAGYSWSIQDEAVTFVPRKGYLPGERVILTSKTGMIGTPQQTNMGVNVKCLLNPNIEINRRIQIDNKSVERFKVNFAIPSSPVNSAAPLTFDGTYRVLTREHQGDTRGVEWYTNLICINMDVSAANAFNSVQGAH